MPMSPPNPSLKTQGLLATMARADSLPAETSESAQLSLPLQGQAWDWETGAASAVAQGEGGETAPTLLGVYAAMIVGIRKPGWVDVGRQSWPRLSMRTPALPMNEAWLANYRSRVLDQRSIRDQQGEVDSTAWMLAPFVRASLWQMAMLAHREMPLRVLGAVHTGLELHQRRAFVPGERVSFRFQAVPGVSHARGVEHGLLFSWHGDDGAEMGRGLSAYLLPQPKVSSERGEGREPALRPAGPATSLLGSRPDGWDEASGWREVGEPWVLPHDLGRRYAPVSLDYNPIHLWGWSARWLGFRQPIAHGMALAARALAEAHPVARGLGAGEGRLSIQWLKPCLLPRTAQAWMAQASGGRLFGELRSDGQTPHLKWSWTPAAGVDR